MEKEMKKDENTGEEKEEIMGKRKESQSIQDRQGNLSPPRQTIPSRNNGKK